MQNLPGTGDFNVDNTRVKLLDEICCSSQPEDESLPVADPIRGLQLSTRAPCRHIFSDPSSVRSMQRVWNVPYEPAIRPALTAPVLSVLKLAQQQEVLVFKWSDVFDTRDVRGHSLQQSASLQIFVSC